MKNKFEILKDYYESPRITREYLDCSMPMTFDQYGNCGYSCAYCFSTFQRAISGGAENYLAKKVKKVSVNKIKRIFTDLDNPKNKFAPFIKNRITLQWGGLSDPFCPIEEQEGTGYELLKFFKEIKYPICFSSKSDLLLRSERYFDLFRGMEKYWSYKASIITYEENKALVMEGDVPYEKMNNTKRIEASVPSPEERLQVLKKLSGIGIWTIIRVRPFVIGLTDLTYEKLLYKAAEYGVKAVSTEFFCLELRSINKCREKYNLISKIVGFDIVQFYKNISVTQGYLRLNKAIKEPYYKRMAEICKETGMNFHVSDAHGKEYGVTGSCCGLPENEDGSFKLTKFSKNQFTNALQIAKKKGIVTWDDVIKDDIWLKTIQTNTFWHGGSAGEIEKKCKMSAFDFMRNEWNNPKSANSPYRYFVGALKPWKLDKNKNIIYKYNSNVKVEPSAGCGECTGCQG